mmetsp:Transcript_7690/g.20084  ORF Transcript_7690/g.20084 Transcript_7690/m.20084 type:complete len:206 (-) Transcript_7690:450-1067(-)|eukprot:CAMPEP_0115850108 /NCGR_PEP_ID=MMETSP0287-20121206/11794_1 /TAXON_ID=412157 /ORGANISM="Chrysochromulina rotalis, Strain UIO044" /LENGTH=205 /DNA_ID=CAMNT_0003304095 /DNA_START=767 /DNA_END=1384 /DNA_ORIENTATION=+
MMVAPSHGLLVFPLHEQATLLTGMRRNEVCCMPWMRTPGCCWRGVIRTTRSVLTDGADATMAEPLDEACCMDAVTTCEFRELLPRREVIQAHHAAGLLETRAIESTSVRPSWQPADDCSSVPTPEDARDGQQASTCSRLGTIGTLGAIHLHTTKAVDKPCHSAGAAEYKEQQVGEHEAAQLVLVVLALRTRPPCGDDANNKPRQV